jgi:hypothetical protein
MEKSILVFSRQHFLMARVNIYGVMEQSTRVTGKKVK